jgi:hypothetical protein
MLAIDLRRADIPLETSQGVVDFHSLRVTAINLLMSQGASAVETQAFARHQSLQMTLGVYGRAQANRMSALVETLAEALQVQPVCAPAVHAEAVGETSSTPMLVMTRDPERPTMPPRQEGPALAGGLCTCLQSFSPAFRAITSVTVEKLQCPVSSFEAACASTEGVLRRPPSCLDAPRTLATDDLIGINSDV